MAQAVLRRNSTRLQRAIERVRSPMTFLVLGLRELLALSALVTTLGLGLLSLADGMAKLGV